MSQDSATTIGPWGPHSTASPWEASPPDAGVAPPDGTGATAPPRPSATLRLAWGATPGLAALSVVNTLLKIVTLGFYSFWGKTEIRRRVWSAVRIDGEPLDYTGTGRELFVGFCLVFAVVILPGILIALAASLFASAGVDGAIQAALYAVFALLYGIGIHRAQRYRLSRTRWRGIRMRLGGSSLAYGWTYLWTLALLPLTLGWLAPWRTTLLQHLLTSHMSFGDRPFRFTASSGPLYGRFAILWLGTAAIITAAITLVGTQLVPLAMASRVGPVPDATKLKAGLVALATLAVCYLLYGIVSAWYRAGVINHFAAHTAIEGIRFRGRASAGGLVWLAVSNTLIVLATVGILAPVAQARSARYLVDHLSIEGDVDLVSIRQAPHDRETRGEGLAQAFDVDAF